MAVIAFDNSPTWQKDLRRYLGLDELNPEIESEIEKQNREKEYQRMKRSNKEYCKKANQGKKEHRDNMKLHKRGQNDYNPLCKKEKVKKLPKQ
jgi:hypothetical protein